MLEDLAILTGGRVISDEAGFKLENTVLTDLGVAKRVVIDKDNTTLIEGAGKDADIKGRVQQLKKQIEDTTSDYDRKLKNVCSGRQVAINVGLRPGRKEKLSLMTLHGGGRSIVPRRRCCGRVKGLDLGEEKLVWNHLNTGRAGADDRAQRRRRGCDHRALARRIRLDSMRRRSAHRSAQGGRRGSDQGDALALQNAARSPRCC
jgi:hypothetical protein